MILPGISANTLPSKPRSFLGGEIEQPIERVAVGHRHEVDEIPGFGAPEQRKQLVYGELLARKQGEARAFLGGEEARVASEVDLGPIPTVVHEQPGKARVVDHPLDV